MKLYKTSRTVLSVINNPQQFLNGITSNDMDAPRNAFVNIHGKIIATFDQIKVSDDEFYLVIEKDFVALVLEHTDKFAKLSRARIDPLEKHVYFRLDQGDDPHLGAVPDWLQIPQKKGELVLTDQVLEAVVSEEEFTLFRLKHNIPRLGVDYKDEFLLNIAEDEFVSFTKGCFLGQEPISKVHNRSKPTWKLVVKPAEDCSEQEKQKMTSKSIDPDTGKVIGFVFVRNQ